MCHITEFNIVSVERSCLLSENYVYLYLAAIKRILYSK
jgi:hypothetical protein